MRTKDFIYYASATVLMATLGDRPIMGVIIGAGLTMLIQSSAATIGILQSLYSGGLLDLQGTAPNPCV